MSNEQLVEQIQNGAEENRQQLLLELFEQNRGIIFQHVKNYIVEGRTEEDDLMQQSFLGLIEAANRYDPDRGAGFVTYLIYWVKAICGGWAKDQRNIRRIPRNLQDRINKYKQYIAEFRKEHGFVPSDRRAGRVLGLTPEQMQEVKRCCYEGETISLDDIIPHTEDSMTYESIVADESVDVEGDAIAAVDDERDSERLWAEVDALPDCQPEVIKRRYAEQKSMAETAKSMGIPRGRVQNAEYHALKRLRNNKSVKAIGEEWGFSSWVYSGSLGKFKRTHTSIVEEEIIWKLEKEEEQSMRVCMDLEGED